MKKTEMDEYLDELYDKKKPSKKERYLLITEKLSWGLAILFFFLSWTKCK